MLCYYDSLSSGLVPCRLVAYDLTADNGLGSFRLEPTTNRGFYARGERIETNRLHAIPRFAVRRLRSMSGPHIMPYDWRAVLASHPQFNREQI